MDEVTSRLWAQNATAAVASSGTPTAPAAPLAAARTPCTMRNVGVCKHQKLQRPSSLTIVYCTESSGVPVTALGIESNDITTQPELAWPGDRPAVPGAALSWAQPKYLRVIVHGQHQKPAADLPGVHELSQLQPHGRRQPQKLPRRCCAALAPALGITPPLAMRAHDPGVQW